MLQLTENRLLWRRRKQRDYFKDFCCHKIYSSLILIGCITLLPQGRTQYNDDVYVVKPTPAFRFGKEELTTVLLLNNENHRRYINVRPELGLLTSTARTFIQEGVTTEYATQVVGTTLDNGRVYAQYLKKSSRVLYDSGSPLPSVVTSWVGETLNSDVAFLPQSHNELFDADQPDWQAIDDRVLADHRHKNDFVSISDNANLPSLLSTISNGNEELVLKTSSISSYTPNSKSAFNLIGQLEENAVKVAANKVLPIGDLPTYTVKQNYEPNAYVIRSDEVKLKEDFGSGEAFSRNPKLIYKKMMLQSSLKSETVSHNFSSLRPIISVRQFATITYYGFADFTTVVGDSVIVFSPRSSTSDLNYNAHITSITGEATLGTGITQGLQVPKVAITVNQHQVKPTLMQQSMISAVLEKPFITIEARDDENAPFFGLNFTEPVKNKTIMEAKESKPILEMSEIALQLLPTLSPSATQSTISSSFSISSIAPVMLTRPSNEDIQRIYKALAKAGKSKLQSSSSVDEAANVSLSLADDSLQVSSEATTNVKLFGGATTIFFEDDPFANFVVPSTTSSNLISQPNSNLNSDTNINSNIKTNTSINSNLNSNFKSNSLTNDDISTESSPAPQDKNTEFLEFSNSPEVLTHPGEIFETTTATTIITEESLTTPKQNLERFLNNTKKTLEADREHPPTLDNKNSNDLLPTVFIKEIDQNNDDDEILSDCIKTSQVFLTQLPKTVTRFETVIKPEASVPTLKLKTEVKEEIQHTFEVQEATKYYCIQASAMNSAEGTERPLVRPPVNKEDDMITTESYNEEDATDLDILNTTENYDNEDKTERIDVKEVDKFDKSELKRDEDEEASGHVEEEDNEEEEEEEEEEEIELVYKTLYTTYTYLTTFFLDDATSISSHTDVVTNIMTSTLGKSFIKEAVATTTTKFMANLNDNEINPSTLINAIPMETSKRFVVPSEVQYFIRTGEEVNHQENELDLLHNSILATDDSSVMLATFYTTYTYYTTIFAEGETEIMSHTEVITNTKKSAVSTTSGVVEDEKIMLTISTLPTKTIASPSSSSTRIHLESGINCSVACQAEVNSKGQSSLAKVVSNLMTSTLPDIPDLGDLSSITLVTDVRSSSSPGNKQIINNFKHIQKHFDDKIPQQQFEDQISSESNTDRDEIMPSATLLLQTSFTTFTYYTTMYSDEETKVISRLETMTNTVTETLQPSKTTMDLIEASVPTTYFTTFTYWTKLAREGQITTLSREEIISNIITPTVVERETTLQTEELAKKKEVIDVEQPMKTESTIMNKVSLQLAEQENITVRMPAIKTLNDKDVPEPTTYYTTYTYYTTSYEANNTVTDSRFETVTNIITPSPTATLTEISKTQENSVPLESQRATPSLTAVQDHQGIIKPPGSNIVLHDFKKIIDADGISTIFFTTQIKNTINLDGSLTQVSSSTSSLIINQEKQSIQALLTLKSSSKPIIGPDGQQQKQYKTGLVRLIEGTRIANFTTTLYQSKVIGTVIDQRYAQIIESTSSFIFEKTSDPENTPNSNAPIQPTTTTTSMFEHVLTTHQMQVAPIQDLFEVEGSFKDSQTEKEIQITSSKQANVTVEEEEENNSKTDEKLRFPFQSKKSPVISPHKPFAANRNRPQFAPKKNSTATIITRSDFTPTITATPALKTVSRYSSARRSGTLGIPNSNSGINGATPSKRFGRPNKSSGSGNTILASSASSRNWFASSSNVRGSFASSSRRLGGSLPTIRPSFSRPYLFSSSFPGNSRLRVRPSATTTTEEDALASEDIFTSRPGSGSQQQEEGFKSEESNNGEEEITTESNRRQNNPLLRLRRPLNRPQSFTPAAARPNSLNNAAVSLRRNPLISRQRTGNSNTLTTTTSTTTVKPRQRAAFQSPLITQNRVRPLNSLLPQRNIFGGQKLATSTEENRDLSEEDVNENNDDAEYDDEEDEESEADDEEDTRRRRRRRRTNNKVEEHIVRNKTRSKRQIDNSQQNRSNFRNRLRRPKLASYINQEPKSTEGTGNETKDVITTNAPLLISSQKSRARFGSRFSGHASSSSTAASTAILTGNHKAIRPTRPSTSNSGRAQFTLREKDLSLMSTTQKGLATTVKRPAFRRPSQAGVNVSARRLPSSTAASSSSSLVSGKRRLKSFSNNDSTTTSRNPVTGRTRSSSTISGRSRTNVSSRDNNNNNNNIGGGRNRARNKNNNEANMLDNGGIITVTHVIPTEVTIPVINGKVTEYKQVVTAKTTTEILQPQQYTTTIGANGLSRLVLTREDSSINYNGAMEVTKYLLHETPTTTITFTPTTIRGRKTSFSHVLPSTVYSVEAFVTTVQPQISPNAPLANILLSQLLLGNVGIPAANPLLGALGGALTNPGVALGTAAVGTPQPATPVTEYKTHASTYITTVFEASQNLRKQLQHFDTHQDEPKSLNPLNTSYDYSNIGITNDNININNNQSDDIDEARYNLATRIMSNGVEVIIASDKTKMPPDHLMPDIYNTQLQYKKPMTLAASTIKNQMMILLLPSSLNTTTQQSSQQQKYNFPFYTNHFITKTCLTTYTYRTTYVQDGLITVESREKVITNTATEERNYPQITPTQAIGVTLTKTPELAVGIFPTTYSYYNTIKDNSHKLQVMTSEYIIVNTITGPSDYVAYLQPTAIATPTLETHIYYNEVTLSEKVNSSMQTVKRNITQVVVTKSYAPALSTSVLTSYYAYDGDNIDGTKANLKFLTTLVALKENEKEEEKEEKKDNLNSENKKIKTADMHIYTTKTFLTTLTYYTTTVINSYLTDSSHTNLPLSTVFNYYTRVIENVITDSVPHALVPNELLAKMKLELSKQKAHERQRIIVTSATLKNGQSIKISAMKMTKNNRASISLTVTPTLLTTTTDSQFKPEESSNHSMDEINEENFHNSEDDQTLDNLSLEEGSTSFDHLTYLGNVQHPQNVEEEGAENNGFDSLPSEQILTVVDVPNNNPQVVNNKPSTISNTNHLIQRLTALKPVFSAVADLLQNNFGVSRDTLNSVVTNNESIKSTINNKINSSTFDVKHPIYIPVPKIPLQNKPYEFSNYTDFAGQGGLHIKPPLLGSGSIMKNFEINDKKILSNDKHSKASFSKFKTPGQQQPLYNGGIYIRPGEIITANSDVIVGKPNGIEYAKMPKHQINDENTSNVYQAADHYQITYYHNKVQHAHKIKPSSAFTSITYKPLQIPLNNNVKSSSGLRPANDQLFNKNILKPPPLPLPPSQPIIRSSSKAKQTQQGLALVLTAPHKATNNRSKQKTTTKSGLSKVVPTTSRVYLPPLIAISTHRTEEFQPSSASTVVPLTIAKPSGSFKTYDNFHNQFALNNEISKIYKKSQHSLSNELKTNLIKYSNFSNSLNPYNNSSSYPTFDTNSGNTNNIPSPQGLAITMRWQPELNIVQAAKEEQETSTEGHSISNPQTLPPSMRWQPELNIKQETEKEQEAFANGHNIKSPITLATTIRWQPELDFAQYFPKYNVNSNWYNTRPDPPIKISTSPLYINEYNANQNYEGSPKISDPEIAHTHTLIDWNLDTLHQTQTKNQFSAHINNMTLLPGEKYKNSAIITNQHNNNNNKRVSAPESLNKQADTKVFFKTLLTSPNTKFSYNLSAKSTLNNENHKKHFNKSGNKSHQNISLDHDSFSQTVDVKVPPLTFKREDYENYPENKATAVRGKIPNVAETSYKLMPLIKIPANKQQVQVSLTPSNLIKAMMTLPQEVTKEEQEEQKEIPAWNSMQLNPNNDKNKNNIFRKISLNTDRKKLFSNNPEQKTRQTTNNNLNINPSRDGHTNWKHRKRQEQAMVNTTNPLKTVIRPTADKIPKTEQQHRETTLISQRKDFYILPSLTTQTLILKPTEIDFTRPALQQTLAKIGLNELERVNTQLERTNTKLQRVSTEANQLKSLTSECLENNSKHKPLGLQPPQATIKTFKTGIQVTTVATPKTNQSGNIIPKTAAHSGILKTSEMQQKKKKIAAKATTTINKIFELKNTHEKLIMPAAIEIKAHESSPFKKLIYNNNKHNKEEEEHEQGSNQTKMVSMFLATGEAFRTTTSTSNLTSTSNSTLTNKDKSSSKLITVKPKFQKTAEILNLDYGSNFMSKENIITQETMNMKEVRTPSNINTKLMELKTNKTTEITFGLHNPNASNTKTLPHFNTKNKIALPNNVQINKSQYTDGEKNQHQINNTNKETSMEENFIFTNTNADGVTQIDEHIAAINREKNKNENANTQHKLNLATKNVKNFNQNSAEKLKIFNLQPSETYEAKILITTTSLNTLPLASTTPSYTTTTITTTTATIKRIILPAKYITNKRVYTITATASIPNLLLLTPTTAATTTALNLNSNSTEVTTLFLTHTQNNTVINTVSLIKTIEPLTITPAASTTVKPTAAFQKPLTKLTTLQTQPKQLTSDQTFKYIEQKTLENKQNLTYLPYPTIEIVSTNVTQQTTHNPNENSIFIIMTNNNNKKNNNIYEKMISPQIKNHQKIIDEDNDETNEVMIEYDNGITFDEISIRDEEPLHIINGKSVTSSAFANNELSVTESSSADHFILGGVLIARPSKFPPKNFNSSHNNNLSCQPKCKAARNEHCVLVDNNWSCFCKPGFARAFPDRSCKPTYFYNLIIHADRIGNYSLQYMDDFENNKTGNYRQLSQLVSTALDRMIMQSDFRDVYYGTEVTGYADSGRRHHGIIINVLIQLSDNSSEKRLEEVFKKNLRLSNYSIGGTELYTSKSGVDALVVKDFDECTSRRLNDCSENAHCFNLIGSYTCSCVTGYADLSENPIYPGRICSSEQIGCETCHYHGKCLTLMANANYRNYCECFPWYAGSKCQVNLKILLIVLLGIATLLFILLLFCILITCTKRRNNLQHTITSNDGVKKNSRLSTSLLITSVGLRKSLPGGSLKNTKRQKPIKIDKRLIIKDSSSETSQNSLPYVLKNRDQIASSCNKKKSCLLKQSKNYRNTDSQGNAIKQYPVSVPSNLKIEGQSDLNTVLTTSSTFSKNNQAAEQQILLGNVTEYEGHYCEQSDRSLTVMIPRAKYHSSVLSQTHLMHHQLTMERVRKVQKSERKLINAADKEPVEKRNHKNNFCTTKEINDEGYHQTKMPSNPGALISAGFEVSAIIRDNTTVVNSGHKQNDLVHFGSLIPGYNLISTSESATSLDSIADQKQQQFIANKKISASESDLIDTMDQWLGNVKLNELSTEARSFDETTIRATTKPLHVSVECLQTQLHDEFNTMAERDLGSTFLLPHTHLYKPDRECKLPGLDSF